MITIDSRVGSKDLLKLFPKGMSVLNYMEFGDVKFLGRGVGGVPVPVGFERKKMPDLIDSMNSGRLTGHQLPGLVQTYAVVYLVVEGLWRASPGTGVLELWKGKKWQTLRTGPRSYMAREIINFLQTLQTYYPSLYVWRSGNNHETVNFITSLYHWWTDKDLDEHKAHLQEYKPFVSLRKQTTIERGLCAMVDDIGPKRARNAVLKLKYNNVKDLTESTLEDWMSIDGIGPKLASKIMKVIYG